MGLGRARTMGRRRHSFTHRTKVFCRGESFGFRDSTSAASAVDGALACAVHAEAQETNGTVAEAQGCVPPLPIATVGRVVQLINPVLRGWVNYFAVGHSSECFSLIKNW